MEKRRRGDDVVEQVFRKKDFELHAYRISEKLNSFDQFVTSVR